MFEGFKSYFGKLERLSDGELDRSAEKVVCAEKQNVTQLIAHIAEMSRRKVALELGYKSTFHYYVERLHLSEGSVASRIHVASADRSFKEKFERLAEVMSVENAQRHMAEILGQALEIALDK